MDRGPHTSAYQALPTGNSADEENLVEEPSAIRYRARVPKNDSIRRGRWNPYLIFFILLLLILPIATMLLPNWRTAASDHAYGPVFTNTRAQSDVIGQLTSAPERASDHWNPSHFPTSVGEELIGPTATGVEPALIATAHVYPSQGVDRSKQHEWPLVRPQPKGAPSPDFNLLQHLGPLSPYFSAPSDHLPMSSPLIPNNMTLKQVHLLHRHGARYPTPNSIGAVFAEKLRTLTNSSADSVGFTDDLAFLNTWTYKLGTAILTPAGRKMMYDSGVGFRQQYGYLLDDFRAHRPVVRTTTQDRMYKSAINWLGGFFGLPLDDQYHLVLDGEAAGINSTLAPWKACPLKNAERGAEASRIWRQQYLPRARDRLQNSAHGFVFDVEDMNDMQELCAYETVALGYSEFCKLFTEEEWRGYEYAWDLRFYYAHAFGSDEGKAGGIGYVQELVSRLTETPITSHNSSTNATQHASSKLFPLDQPMYMDFTHDTAIAAIVTALNLTQFDKQLSLTHRPLESESRWRISWITPFAANLVVQRLLAGQDDRQYIRIVLNDAVMNLSGINGCPHDPHGLCPLEAFLDAMRISIRDVDFAWDCASKREVIRDRFDSNTGRPSTDADGKPII